MDNTALLQRTGTVFLRKAVHSDDAFCSVWAGADTVFRKVLTFACLTCVSFG